MDDFLGMPHRGGTFEGTQNDAHGIRDKGNGLRRTGKDRGKEKAGENLHRLRLRALRKARNAAPSKTISSTADHIIARM